MARDAFVDVATRWPYPFGAFFDDALYFAATLEMRLGRPKEAVALLERMLAQREVAGFMGSYERPRYLPALLLIAQIYETTGELSLARTTLHRLYTDFGTSTQRDDALWREAELWRKDGDARSSCKRLATLVADFPDSRYVPCTSLKCPDIKRPSPSRAPPTCHAYLLEETMGSERR